MTTAEEFFRAKLKALKPNEERITLRLHKIDCETAMRWGHEWAKQYLSEHSTKVGPLTKKEIEKAVSESIEGFGPSYYEAISLFKRGMKKAIQVINKRTPVKKTV